MKKNDVAKLENIIKTFQVLTNNDIYKNILLQNPIILNNIINHSERFKKNERVENFLSDWKQKVKNDISI